MNWTLNQIRSVVDHFEDVRTQMGVNKTRFCRELGTSIQQYEKWCQGHCPGLPWLERIETQLLRMGYKPKADPQGVKVTQALNTLMTTNLENVTAMCRALGIAQMTYHNWKRGSNTPYLHNLEAAYQYIASGMDRSRRAGPRQPEVGDDQPWTIEELYNIAAKLTTLRSRFKWTRKDLDQAVGTCTVEIERTPAKITLHQAMRLRDFILRHTTVRSDNARLRFRRRTTPGQFEVEDTMMWLPFIEDTVKQHPEVMEKLPKWCTMEVLKSWAEGEDPNLFLIYIIRRECTSNVPCLQK